MSVLPLMKKSFLPGCRWVRLIRFLPWLGNLWKLSGTWRDGSLPFSRELSMYGHYGRFPIIRRKKMCLYRGLLWGWWRLREWAPWWRPRTKKILFWIFISQRTSFGVNREYQGMRQYKRAEKSGRLRTENAIRIFSGGPTWRPLYACCRTILR